jgi:hypothetical protein
VVCGVVWLVWLGFKDENTIIMCLAGWLVLLLRLLPSEAPAPSYTAFVSNGRNNTAKSSRATLFSLSSI